MKDRAFAEVAAALAAGEIVGIFPEGQITHTGDINPFRPGVQQISRRRRFRSCRWRCADCGGASSRARTRAARCAASAASFRGSRSSQRRPCAAARGRRADALFARVSALARRRPLIGATNGERVDADRDDVVGCSGRNDDRARLRRCTCRRFRRSSSRDWCSTRGGGRARLPRLSAAALARGAECGSVPAARSARRRADAGNGAANRSARIGASHHNGRGRAPGGRGSGAARCARSGGRDAAVLDARGPQKRCRRSTRRPLMPTRALRACAPKPSLRPTRTAVHADIPPIPAYGRARAASGRASRAQQAVALHRGRQHAGARRCRRCCSSVSHSC